MCDPPFKELWAIGSNFGPRLVPPFHLSQRSRGQRTFGFFYFTIFVFLFILNSTTFVSAGLVLSEHIQHFEPVFYEESLLRKHHNRAKRDASHTVAFDFTAHNREFKIRLKRDASIFADDVVFESTEGTVDFDINKVYSGTLEDDDLVEVQGVVTKEGYFDGHVSTPHELYYLEPASRYLTDVDFHSVMYKASDVLHPQPARCASQQLHFRGKVHNPWMPSRGPKGPEFEPLGVPISPLSSSSSIASKDEPVRLRHHTHPKLEAVKFNKRFSDRHKSPLSKIRESNSYLPIKSNSTFAPSYNSIPSMKSKRYKRSIIDPKKTTCMLYLQADHLFFRQEGSEEACIDKITRHVQRVNNIYKVTDFDRDGKQDQVGFMIKRIKIHTENATKDPNYRFPGNYGVEKFLELFSEEDYDAFCLAYMFTYRDFEGGTLGLAWTGDLKNAGGVCEKNGHYRGSLKSLNTGIVTLLNYGKKVPPAVSHVTLAHEIGHNFGSPHDPEDSSCTPGGEDGNFIMFARATSGDKQNNNKFSPCSLKQINNVLNSKARDAKGCFTEPQRAICGNGVVEDGEECDCGWQEDCEESCCYPMVTNPSRHHKPCTLRPAKICSPSQGPCCTKNCDLKQGDLCREDNGCRDSSFCGGMSPHCPPSINKPNKTICKDEFVCYKGECTGSICLAYGLDSCQCEREAGDPDTKSCELCCKLPGEDQTCLSSFDWNVPPYNIPDMYAKPGTPCDNYKGYCDVFQKCREVDPSGPLATLRKILLSNESLANLQKWIVDHWYAVLFVVLALIVILVAITKLFGRQAEKLHSTKKHSKKKGTKSKKTIMHKNGGATNGQFMVTTNGTTPEGPNHVVHPTVVRTNIPFKRKVNEVKRAATKAKKAAKSQLGRPSKKSSEVKKTTDGTVTSPTESEKSGNNVAYGNVVKPTSKHRDKDRISSRFSIISFKPFRPKSLSPDKLKNIKIYDKRKSGVPGARRTKSKTKVNSRSKSPEKKRKSLHDVILDGRARSPNKKDERRKSKVRTSSPEKGLKSGSPEKFRKHRPKLPERNVRLAEGNWLINKFLADEEKIAKPTMDSSLAGSMNGSLNSIQISPGSGTASGSPISHTRNGSTRALLGSMNHGSPVRGIVNEAFIGSPRNARTHSSLRVTKSMSPNAEDNFYANKYRRSISMTATAYDPSVGVQEKRKKSNAKEGNSDKKRRYCSPEKTQRSPVGDENPRISPPPSSNSSSSNAGQRRRSSGSLPSSANSSFTSIALVPEKVRGKMSLLGASHSSSRRPSIVSESRKNSVSSSSFIGPKMPPKDWV